MLKCQASPALSDLATQLDLCFMLMTTSQSCGSIAAVVFCFAVHPMLLQYNALRIEELFAMLKEKITFALRLLTR